MADFKLLNLLLLIVIAINVFLPFTQARSIKYCDKKGDYVVKVDKVVMSPDPVVTGKPATFNLSASTDTAITGGKLLIAVSYLGVHVHSETHDLCEEVSCPVAAGDFVLSHTQTLPGFTPPGTYTIKMTMKDEKDQQLTCISFTFRIGLRSLVSDS